MIDLAYILEHAFKRCSRCGELKPAFPWWFYRRELALDGLSACCIDCTKSAGKARYTKYYEKNRTRIRQIRQQIRHTELGRAGMTCEKARRKAKRAGVDGDITASEWKQILDNSNGCGWCREPFIDGDVFWQATMDHVIPISRGGSNGADNVVAAHLYCNSKKGNRLPSEIPDGFFEIDGLICKVFPRRGRMPLSINKDAVRLINYRRA